MSNVEQVAQERCGIHKNFDRALEKLSLNVAAHDRVSLRERHSALPQSAFSVDTRHVRECAAVKEIAITAVYSLSQVCSRRRLILAR